jgi:hypothetical protein
MMEVRLVNELFGSGHCALPELLQHSPHLADVYFNDIGFRRSQRVITGQARCRTRKGRQVTKTL